MAEVIDEQLTQALREARKMARCFALVLRGTDAVRLEVRKKPYRASELAEMRTQAKGNRCFSGVVRQVESGELLFESLDAPPEVKLQKFKEHVFEQTRLRIAPRFEQVATLPDVESDEETARQRWQAVQAIWTPRFVAALQRCSEEQASRLRAAFAAAQEQAEGGRPDKALQILERIAPVLRQAGEGTGEGRGEGGGRIVASRKFLLTRFRQIRADLEQALETLRADIARTAADQNPDELAAGMKQWLDRLLDRLQAGIDQSIDEGDGFRAAQSVIQELKGGLLSDELLDHLFDNPLMGGERFVEAIACGLDEIARELAASSAV